MKGSRRLLWLIGLAAIVGSVWCAAGSADDANLGPLVCHQLRQTDVQSQGQCVSSMNHGGTYTFIAGTIGVYNGTYDDVEYEFFDGTGHLVGVQITTQTGDALRFSIRTYDSSVVRTLIVPAGSTGGYLDLSGENFYLAKSQGQLQMTWDEEFGGL